MFALIDCNNFYVSCERVFNPTLHRTPVVVLSNNDGCIIARSEEAKEMGVSMGMPYHELRLIRGSQKIKVCSSNYALYGDFSSRLMQLLHECPFDVEPYSIDEAFLYCNDPVYEDVSYWNNLREKISQWLGLPVSIGVGPTKTLAKCANALAKKTKERVLVWRKDDHKDLSSLDLEDIWGIGRRFSKKLKILGYHSPTALQDVPITHLSRLIPVTLQRSIMELQGLSCLPIECIPSEKKSIVVSRSFGKKLSTLFSIKQAIIEFIMRGTRKLKKQQAFTNGLGIFLIEYPSGRYVYRSKQLNNSTDDIFVLIKLALEMLQDLLSAQQFYKKAGIWFYDLTLVQNNKLEQVHPIRSSLLTDTIHSINNKFGKNTVTLATQLGPHEWQQRSANASPSYTTNWDQLKKVR